MVLGRVRSRARRRLPRRDAHRRAWRVHRRRGGARALRAAPRRFGDPDDRDLVHLRPREGRAVIRRGLLARRGLAARTGAGRPRRAPRGGAPALWGASLGRRAGFRSRPDPDGGALRTLPWASGARPRGSGLCRRRRHASVARPARGAIDRDRRRVRGGSAAERPDGLGRGSWSRGAVILTWGTAAVARERVRRTAAYDAWIGRNPGAYTDAESATQSVRTASSAAGKADFRAPRRP